MMYFEPIRGAQSDAEWLELTQKHRRNASILQAIFLILFAVSILACLSFWIIYVN